MVFKRNVTVTVACVITECFLSLISAIYLPYLFLALDKIDKAIEASWLIPCFLLAVNGVLLVISLICQIFMKTKYRVHQENLVIESEEGRREISYADVAEVRYDFGNLAKSYGRSSKLVLLDKDGNALLSVDNPSIIMTHLIKKRCKGAKMTYAHPLRWLCLFLLINGIVLVCSILAKMIS